MVAVAGPGSHRTSPWQQAEFGDRWPAHCVGSTNQSSNQLPLSHVYRQEREDKNTQRCNEVRTLLIKRKQNLTQNLSIYLKL